MNSPPPTSEGTGTSGPSGRVSNWNEATFQVLLLDQSQNEMTNSESGMPVLPPPLILSQILDIYFEKCCHIVGILHPEKFQRDLNSRIRIRAEFHQQPSNKSAYGYQKVDSVSRPLLLSMLAVAAQYHPLFSSREGQEFVRNAFYERARRAILQSPEIMNLTVLKTAIHISFYCTNNTLWREAYFWHGYNVNCSRYLNLPTMDLYPKNLTGDAEIIEAEEMRRCFWILRQSDILSATSSKKIHHFQEEKEFASVKLPLGQSDFTMLNPSEYPFSNLTIDKYLLSPPQSHQILDPFSSLVVIQAIFARITNYRIESEQAPSNNGFDVFNKIIADLDTFYSKLPDGAKNMDLGIFPTFWNEEMDRWAILLIIYHATHVCLHAPEYNMMGMGRQLFNNGSNFGNFNRFVRDAEHLDGLLAQWENSDSFIIGLQHADQAVKLIREKVSRSKIAAIFNQDTPFFSYCCCQVGLINLIAIRQVILSQDSNSQQVTRIMKEKVNLVIDIISNHADFFGGSAIGKGLLMTIMNELVSGQLTLKTMENQLNLPTSATQSTDNLLVQKIISSGISETSKLALDQPGKCAGSFMT